MVASLRLSIGLKKSGLDERQAAAVRAGSKQRNMAPKTIIYQATGWRLDSARVGCTNLGKFHIHRQHDLEEHKCARRHEENKRTIARPNAVMVSSSLIAPISFKKFHELLREATLGGLIALPRNL